MRSFQKHFAFIVFLFAYVSHYVANAEICIYPASLDSHYLADTQLISVSDKHSRFLCCIQFVFALVEHLMASRDYLTASAVTSTSYCESKNWHNEGRGVQGYFCATKPKICNSYF